MTLAELMVALVVAAAGYAWFAALRARERALREAESVCRAQGLQMLDGSVAGTGWRVRLRPWSITREYAFLVSATGSDRQRATLRLYAGGAVAVDLTGVEAAALRSDPARGFDEPSR